MIWIKAIIIAFSTYSKLPMPQVEWDDEAMALAIGFLPLVGAVIGLFVWGWWLLCSFFEIGAVLFSAVGVVLPIVISGGIHLDGYCDTSDALASWQNRERKLEIMSDPHIGAFALIHSSIYLILNFGIIYELYDCNLFINVFFVYILSRCLAVYNALSIPNAKKDGMLVAFKSTLSMQTVKIILSLFTILSVVGLLLVSTISGVTALVVCIPVTPWYRSMVKKNFGGATGDTTGFYIQFIELVLLFGIFAGGIINIWL